MDPASSAPHPVCAHALDTFSFVIYFEHLLNIWTSFQQNVSTFCLFFLSPNLHNFLQFILLGPFSFDFLFWMQKDALILMGYSVLGHWLRSFWSHCLSKSSAIWLPNCPSVWGHPRFLGTLRLISSQASNQVLSKYFLNSYPSVCLRLHFYLGHPHLGLQLPWHPKWSGHLLLFFS